ncbi:MAG: hypothetical protein MI674_04995 [Cytophagales bacterium]|nr:hypothetical protein [Cytophagales bacterium]
MKKWVAIVFSLYLLMASSLVFAVAKQDVSAREGARGVPKLFNQFNSVESLINSSTFKQLERSNQVLQTTIKGNGEAIFKTLSQGGQKLPSGAVRLPDGTELFKHISKTTGEFTLDINKAGQLYKVRINP